MSKLARIHKVLGAIGEHDVTVANAYAEPGYSVDDGALIVFGNWNPRSFDEPDWKRQLMPRAGELLERLGCEVEWSDEWDVCSCGKAFRTSPDSYWWVPSYKYFDGDVTCRDCLLDDPEDYVESVLLNNPEQADTFGVDLKALGFRRLDETFETGLHPGQNDNPRDVVAKLPNGWDYVFQIDNVGQFDTRWSCWIRQN